MRHLKEWIMLIIERIHTRMNHMIILCILDTWFEYIYTSHAHAHTHGCSKNGGTLKRLDSLLILLNKNNNFDDLQGFSILAQPRYVYVYIYIYLYTDGFNHRLVDGNKEFPQQRDDYLFYLRLILRHHT